MRLKALFLAALLAFPLSAAAIETRSGDTATLEGAATDMAFASGGEVRVAAQSEDDVFAAGGHVRVEGARADHLIAAGGEVSIETATARDVIAAGGEVSLTSGTISDDIVAAGGSISLGADATVGGSAMLAGGEIKIEAPVGGDIMAAGGQVTLNSTVGGTVTLTGAEIEIGPNARIAGDLHLRGRSISISPEAVVTGETTREAMPVRDADEHGGRLIFVALFALGLLVQHALVAAALPGLMNGAAARLSGRFWATLGIGALTFLALPVAIILLMITVIGIPLALFLLASCFVLIPLAFTAVSYWVGRLIGGRVNRSEAAPGVLARIGWTLLGALIVLVLCIIPILGFFVWLISAMAGIGALVTQAGARAPAPAAT